MSKPKSKSSATKDAKRVASPPVIRTSAGVRDALFDGWDALRRGEIKVSELNAFSRVGKTITESMLADVTARKTYLEIPEDSRNSDISIPVTRLGRDDS